MHSPWLQQQLQMDAVVDTWWGEPVEIHPWTPGDAVSDGGPDPDRPVLIDVGIYVRPGARITGEGGTQGAQLSTQIVEEDTWLSIVGDLLGDPPIYVKGDRVYFPERDVWFEISYFTPSATNRPNVHLIRIQPSSIVRVVLGSDLAISAPSRGRPRIWTMSTSGLAAGAPALGRPEM